jgi:hypothetical protein
MTAALLNKEHSYLLPYCDVPALVNHISTFICKEELIEFVRHTFVIFRLADSGIDT